MKAPTTVDMRNFNRSVEALAGFAGVSVDRAIEYEAGKVLEGAIRYTPAANLAKMRDSVNNRTFTQLESGKGAKKYKLSHRYPDALWARISKQRAEHFRLLKRARGLAKQSWYAYWTIQELGLRITAPTFVKNARPRNGKPHPENTRASRVRVRGRWALTFENAQPTVNNEYVGGRRALARALQGRARYFEQNLKRGVFSELRQISARYPGLVLT